MNTQKDKILRLMKEKIEKTIFDSDAKIDDSFSTNRPDSVRDLVLFLLKYRCWPKIIKEALNTLLTDSQRNECILMLADINLACMEIIVSDMKRWKQETKKEVEKA